MGAAPHIDLISGVGYAYFHPKFDASLTDGLAFIAFYSSKSRMPMFSFGKCKCKWVGEIAPSDSHLHVPHPVLTFGALLRFFGYGGGVESIFTILRHCGPANKCSGGVIILQEVIATFHESGYLIGFAVVLSPVALPPATHHVKYAAFVLGCWSISLST